MQSDTERVSSSRSLLGIATLREVLMPVCRHWRAGALVAVVLLTAAVTAIVLWPKSYRAEMTLLVKRERADTIVTPDGSNVPQTRADVTEDELNSAVELLKSRELLEIVAVASGLVPNQPSRTGDTAERQTALAKAVRNLRRDLDVTPLRKTMLIKIRYDSPIPTRSFRVLAELGRLYLEEHLRLHRPAGVYQFFSEQKDRFKVEVAEAEARLKEFGRREGVVATDVEKDVALKQLAQFEADLEGARTAVADATRRVTELERLTASTPARHTTQIKRSDNPLVVAQLRPRVLELELKRTDMQRMFTPDYPPLIELEAQLEQARAILESTEQTPLSEETTDGNPTFQLLEGELARARSDQVAAQARLSTIRSSIQVYRGKSRRLDDQGMTEQDLRRSIKSAEENYLLYTQKQEEARISDALDQTRIANVAIAEAPVVPALPTNDRQLLKLALAFAVACVGGILTTFAMHRLSPYFFTPEDVEMELEIPVLASLPARR